MALCEGTAPLGSPGHQGPVGQHGRNQKESLICPGSELKRSLGFSEPHGHILQMGKLRPREIKCHVQKQSWGLDSMTPKCSSTRWKYINIKKYIYMWFVDHFIIFTSITSMILITALRGKESKHGLSSLDRAEPVGHLYPHKLPNASAWVPELLVLGWMFFLLYYPVPLTNKHGGSSISGKENTGQKYLSSQMWAKKSSAFLASLLSWWLCRPSPTSPSVRWSCPMSEGETGRVCSSASSGLQPWLCSLATGWP